MRLRPATSADAPLLRDWRNDPVTRAASRNAAEVGAEEHAAWLASVLTDSNRLLFVAEESGSPVGQVRLDLGDDGHWELSLSLAPSARGRGLGAVLVSGGVERLGKERGGCVVDAWVRRDNPASLAAFRRAGFVEEPDRGDADFTVLSRRT